MSDLALEWNGFSGDLVVADNDLQRNDGLEPAVLLSLFLDRRADPADTLPFGVTERRGWWAAALAEIFGDQYGSRLWLLAREKDEAKVLSRGDEYTREALQWMLDDGVTDRIDVQVSVPQKGVLLIEVTISRPKTDPVVFRYNYNWLAQQARRAA